MTTKGRLAISRAVGPLHGRTGTGPGHHRPAAVHGGWVLPHLRLDGLIEHSPGEYVRRPKIDTESATLGLDRMELSAFIAQAAAGQRLSGPLLLTGAVKRTNRRAATRMVR
jgi:hypothetical protein